ncbi:MULTISPECIES: hypothetical protein [unclassified Vibrio]|uniref:Uncharacterized protein n=1 Tax=Vibrio sp. HB236076 TaxID=3232307 RepID=A0AB39HGL0_9VIBR|nr:hypothetical protein [Vibrio sp. HB161653]MDP5254574.1 hypothetical protein [Vibrio sp. HB161653]
MTKQCSIQTWWLAMLLCMPSVACAQWPEIDFWPFSALKPPVLSTTSTSTAQQKLYIHGNLVEEFDEWRIDTGYRYPILDNVDFVFATRLEHSQNRGAQGLLSGVRYQLTPALSIDSVLHRQWQAHDSVNDTEKTQLLSAELSSRYQLTETLDLHATYDYQNIEQAIAVGIGFRF